MNFEREKKINRLLLQAIQFREPYLKVPIEMIDFAFKERKISEVGSYLTSQLIYSGKAKLNAKTKSEIANILSLEPRTIDRHFEYLLDRDWIGKDSKNGWIFFRGLNKVHEIEGFKYTKSALLFRNNLVKLKGFFIGAIISNFIQSRGTGTDRKSRRSTQSCFPVSLTIVENLCHVKGKTAFNYRKLAESEGYIKMYPNLKQVTGITAKDIYHLKQNNIDRVELFVFGTSDTLSVTPQQLRTDRGFIYAQLPNLITPKVLIGRRNLRRSVSLPPTG